MADAVLERLGLDPADTTAADAAMVGDRLLTDMAMAESAGMTGILVVGGATTTSDLNTGNPRPRYVVETLRQLVPTSA
jgi:ribonucleotide monophosphatase NagD (HAD superfamily)